MENMPIILAEFRDILKCEQKATRKNDTLCLFTFGRTIFLVCLLFLMLDFFVVLPYRQQTFCDVKCVCFFFILFLRTHHVGKMLKALSSNLIESNGDSFVHHKCCVVCRAGRQYEGSQ